MTKRLPIAAVLIMFTCGLLMAQEPAPVLSLKGDGVRVVKVDRVVIIKEDATVVQSFPVTVNAPPGAGLYFWSYPNGVTAVEKVDKLEIQQAPKGQVTVTLKAVTVDLDADGKFKNFVTKLHSLTFTVGDVPLPPKPGPDPKPDPKPDPSIPAPIVGEGLRVMMIEEFNDRATITNTQYDTLFGDTVREWVKANTVKENGQPGFKLYDKDQKIQGEPKHWQDAFKRRPANFTTPWIVISNGTTGYEGPIVDEQKTLELMAKYLLTKK